MMNIVIKRIYLGDNYTIGKLYVDTKYLCDTLEPSLTAGSHPAVAYGTYQVNLVWSPKFKRYMLRLEVPHRTGILFHVGNTAADTSGCILLGLNKTVGHLHDSRKFLERFRAMVIGEMLIHNEIVLCSVEK